ncbi:MAG: DEAD/DEAH box helicase family protein [Thermoplasmata archaeon]|nr:DEAD/DEAH box helicase family protein [Thermoplasmata archaeon]
MIVMEGSVIMDLNEFQTRKQKIDVLLREQGWIVGDKSRVIIEVDTKQSDFNKRDYRTVSETLKNDMESKYADYLLLDSIGRPLAIIEAKRTCKDPILAAQKQAEEYADDIKAQMGRDVIIFLSNGYEIWFWDRERYPQRMVKGFFAQRDLERMAHQIKREKALEKMEINTDIVDRDKSIENVSRVLEAIQKGHRKALIVMATGTGKTRVAMAIIDALRRANRVQKILFLADRIALRDQAYNDGYKEFFPDAPKGKIISGVFERDKELYVSTIQTFMECYNQKDKNGKFLISPGEFDLIISDEAHRSIYNKWKEVFTYLDAIQIGLTATPADMIDKNTFRFFGRTDGTPTAMYDYRDAVEDGILCDFRKHTFGAQTHFQIEGITKESLSRDQKKELLEKGIDPDDVDFEGTDIEKKVIITGTNEAIVREFMEHCIMDKAGTLPAKTIIFAVSKKHAKRLWEAFNKLYPEHKGRLAKIITSEDSKRAQASIDDFKKKDFPRIAISVDMLDTGIDIPEVCNLVFAKPVFSKIKFWQMIGRGTRSDAVCKYKDRLPNGKKDYFKIFDFWKNFEYFEMHPDGDVQETSEAVTTQIFLTRLSQLETLKGHGESEIYERVKESLIADVKSLPTDSVLIRDNIRDVERALAPGLWDAVGVNPIEFLRDKMVPLMRYQQDVNVDVASFTLKVERLGNAILTRNKEEKERQLNGVGNMLGRLPKTINDVKAKEELLDKVTSISFWMDSTFEDCLMVRDEFADLMKYITKESKNPIVLDIDDVIKSRKKIVFGPDQTEAYIDKYKEKVEKRIKDLAEQHPTIQKINNEEVITEDDLIKLEETLNSPELFITEEVLQKIYERNKGTLVQFIKDIARGKYITSDPEDEIRDAFQTYIIENNKDYSADQLFFIRTIQSVFLKNKHIEHSDLFEEPFTNFGTTAPMPMFTAIELKDFLSICETMESELFPQKA